MTHYLVVVAPQVAEAAPETSWFQRGGFPFQGADFMILITNAWFFHPLETINPLNTSINCWVVVVCLLHGKNKHFFVHLLKGNPPPRGFFCVPCMEKPTDFWPRSPFAPGPQAGPTLLASNVPAGFGSMEVFGQKIARLFRAIFVGMFGIVW